MIIMKTKALRTWTAVCVSVLTMTTALKSLAADTATAVKPLKSYTGMVVSVDAKEHTLGLKGFVLSKTFNLGDNCAYMFLDKSAGAMSDLHPGQRVMVVYQDAQGVLVAGRVVQQPMREEGMVKAIDPAQHTLTLHLRAVDRTFQLPDDCAVELRGGQPGTLADIQTGNHVTVTYETPNNKPTARQIAQTSATFTGSLTAIDLEAKTVKARTLLGTKKFNVGDDCAILVNGKPDGKLSDLKPKDRLIFSYNDINGIHVVDRIAPAGTPPASETTATQPMVP
jgi:Cu/Ag efflux protein CusF